MRDGLASEQPMNVPEVILVFSRGSSSSSVSFYKSRRQEQLFPCLGVLQQQTLSVRNDNVIMVHITYD